MEDAELNNDFTWLYCTYMTLAFFFFFLAFLTVQEAIQWFLEHTARWKFRCKYYIVIVSSFYIFSAALSSSLLLFWWMWSYFESPESVCPLSSVQNSVSVGEDLSVIWAKIISFHWIHWVAEHPKEHRYMVFCKSYWTELYNSNYASWICFGFFISRLFSLFGLHYLDGCSEW